MRSVTSSDGTRLAVRSCGPDHAPPLVLVHGLGMSVESWGDVPGRLAEEYRVLAYDLRGHGDSTDGSHGDYSLAAHAEDLRAVVETAVQAGHPATVVGNSLGGGIILEAAQCWDERDVSAAVFAGSGGSGVTAPGLPARGLPPAVRRRLRVLWLDVLRVLIGTAQHLRPLHSLADRITRRMAFYDASPQPAVQQVRRDFLRTRRQALVRTTLASLSHDGVRKAGDLQVPVLVLHGDHDPEVPSREARQLVETLPDAELVTVSGASHMLALTDPDRVCDEIRRWTARAARSTSTASPRTATVPASTEST